MYRAQQRLLVHIFSQPTILLISLVHQKRTHPLRWAEVRSIYPQTYLASKTYCSASVDISCLFRGNTRADPVGVDAICRCYHCQIACSFSSSYNNAPARCSVPFRKRFGQQFCVEVSQHPKRNAGSHMACICWRRFGNPPRAPKPYNSRS